MRSLCPLVKRCGGDGLDARFGVVARFMFELRAGKADHAASGVWTKCLGLLLPERSEMLKPVIVPGRRKHVAKCWNSWGAGVEGALCLYCLHDRGSADMPVSGLLWTGQDGCCGVFCARATDPAEPSATLSRKALMPARKFP